MPTAACAAREGRHAESFGELADSCQRTLRLRPRLSRALGPCVLHGATHSSCWAIGRAARTAPGARDRLRTALCALGLAHVAADDVVVGRPGGGAHRSPQSRRVRKQRATRTSWSAIHTCSDRCAGRLGRPHAALRRRGAASAVGDSRRACPRRLDHRHPVNILELILALARPSR